MREPLLLLCRWNSFHIISKKCKRLVSPMGVRGQSPRKQNSLILFPLLGEGVRGWGKTYTVKLKSKTWGVRGLTPAKNLPNKPAVHAQRLPGNKARLFTGEEHHGLGHLFGPANAA